MFSSSKLDVSIIICCQKKLITFFQNNKGLLQSFHNIFFAYIKMAKNSSAKYQHKIWKDYKHKDRERYQSLSKEEKEKTIIWS